MPQAQSLFKEESKELEDFNHYVHLADGRVLKVNYDGHPGNYPVVHSEGNKRTSVIGVYSRLEDVEE